MNETSYKRIQAFAPIFRQIYSKSPDNKVLALTTLQLLELSELGQVLQDRRQDWDTISRVLLTRLTTDSLFIRTNRLLELIRKHPTHSYEQYATMLNCHPTTVQQTINALKQGGFRFGTAFAETICGRPKVLTKL